MNRSKLKRNYLSKLVNGLWWKNQHWSGIDCSAVNCTSLSGANAVLSTKSTSYKTQVNVTCLSGYQLSNNIYSTVVYCQANKTWSSASTNCTGYINIANFLNTLSWRGSVFFHVIKLTSKCNTVHTFIKDGYLFQRISMMYIEMKRNCQVTV